MRLKWHFAWAASLKWYIFILASTYAPLVTGSYPVTPDAQACSRFLGRPLFHSECQEAVDSLPRGSLPSIFTTRARTAFNNYIEVPFRHMNAQSNPSCMVTIDLDGHSRSDQFVSVPWDELRQMAQVVVNSCVDRFSLGGFITFGVGRTFEALIFPTAYGTDNVPIPNPAWVLQPDETVAFVAIPNTPSIIDYSEFTRQSKLRLSFWSSI